MSVVLTALLNLKETPYGSTRNRKGVIVILKLVVSYSQDWFSISLLSLFNIEVKDVVKAELCPRTVVKLKSEANGFSPDQRIFSFFQPAFFVH